MAQLEVVYLLKQILLGAVEEYIWNACLMPSMKSDLAKWRLEFKNHLGDVYFYQPGKSVKVNEFQINFLITSLTILTLKFLDKYFMFWTS